MSYHFKAQPCPMVQYIPNHLTRPRHFMHTCAARLLAAAWSQVARTIKCKVTLHCFRLFRLPSENATRMPMLFRLPYALPSKPVVSLLTAGGKIGEKLVEERRPCAMEEM